MQLLELQVRLSLFFTWYLDGGASAHKASKVISEVSKLTKEFEDAPDTLRLFKVLRDVVEIFDVVNTILSKLKVVFSGPVLDLRPCIGIIYQLQDL
jgi:hypothetical protein